MYKYEYTDILTMHELDILADVLHDKTITVLSIIWYDEQAAMPSRGADLIYKTHYSSEEVAFILNMLVDSQYINECWEMENDECLLCFRINGDKMETVYDLIHTSQCAS